MRGADPPGEGPAALTVVIADGHTLMREGIARVAERAGWVVSGIAGDAGQLVRAARAHRPDVVIADATLPPNAADDGLRAVVGLRADDPGLGVILLAEKPEKRYVAGLIGDRPAGAGFLLKDRITRSDVLLDAVRRVAAGGSVLDPEALASLAGLRDAGLPGPGPGPLDRLTPREHEVLGLMAQGLSNSGIAEKLVVTTPAVERHVTGILAKLAIGPSPRQHRRVLAVLEYLRGGRGSPADAAPGRAPRQWRCPKDPGRAAVGLSPQSSPARIWD